MAQDNIPMLFGITATELELARAIATRVIRTYGDFDATQWEIFEKQGIWNDHAAVQTAIETIKLLKPRD